MISHTLYRFFDAEGALLYVGRTTNPRQRWRTHEKEKDWFDAVATVTREVFATAVEVDAAERRAIALEAPIQNIALNKNRRADVALQFERPALPVISPFGDNDDHKTRLAAVEENLPESCEGDETVCECGTCHEGRMLWFDELRSRYDWHPGVRAEINRVEKLYFAGAGLFDWYYDFWDISLAARSAVVIDSQLVAIPARVEFRESVAVVDCPFCFDEHRLFLPAGASLDNAYEASCAFPRGGRYRLLEDWFETRNALDRWAKQAEVAA